MARARNIKPGFFLNEELAELPVATRLLFIGLWTLADREGRLEDRPRRIKMALFPADDFNVEEMLCQLDSAGFIARYSAKGIKCIQVVNFSKHQTPHVREAASELPAMSEANAEHCLGDAEHCLGNGEASPRSPDSLIPDSLIPDSLIPDSLIPDCLEEETSASPALGAGAPPCPTDQIVELFNQRCPTLPSVRTLTDQRRKAVRARWREDPERQDLAWWAETFSQVARTPFLTGANDRAWTADFDWLMKPANLVKVVEGKYGAQPQRYSAVTAQNIENLRGFIGEISGRD